MKCNNIIVRSIIIILATSIILLPVEGAEVRSPIYTIEQKYISWNAATFPGFYYDIDKNFSTEELYFTLSADQSMSTAELKDTVDYYGYTGAYYTTTASSTPFDFSSWGQYDKIAFLGKIYFANYSDSNLSGYSVPILYDKSESRNLMSNGQLSEILLDDSYERVFDSSSPLELQGGYELAIKAIDPDGNKIHLNLVKDGHVIDSKVVSPSTNNATIEDETYYYKKDLGETKGIVVLAVHFKDVFSSAGDDAATVDGVFQISDEPIPISTGQQYGEMSVRSIDPTNETIVLDNKDNPIILSKNRDIALMGNIHIRTADQENTSVEDPLRYYLYCSYVDDNANISWMQSVVGTSKVSLEVNASDVLDSLQRGEDVNYDCVKVKGDLNLSKINLNSQHTDRDIYELGLGLSEEPKVVSSFIKMTNSVIDGNVNLRNARFERPIDFANTLFKGDVDFSGSEFSRDVKFENSTFRGNAYFIESVFRDYSYFDKATFDKNAYFLYSMFNNYTAFFWNSTFNSEANFNNTKFNINADFENAKFRGEADFNQSEFNNQADFWNSTFNKDTRFRQSIFSDYADFGNSMFKGEADFWNSMFRGEADFWNSTFNKNSHFDYSVFNGYANFANVMFKDVDFLYSRFYANADFMNSNFNSTARFNFARFGSRTDFSDSRFGKAYFNGTNLGNYSIFSRAKSTGNIINLSNAEFDNFYADWDFANPSSKHAKLKIDMYQKLRENYEKFGLFDDANDCYYVIMEKNGEKENFQDKFANTLANISYGYGVKPWYPFLESLLIIILFAIFFCRLGPFEFSEAILFSFNTFISGAGKLFVETPKLPETSTPTVRLTFVLERILGLIFISLLIIALTRTFFKS